MLPAFGRTVLRTFSALTVSRPVVPLPPTAEFLARLASHPHLPPGAWYLIAAATATTLGHGAQWLPEIYVHATLPLRPSPPEETDPPVSFADDPLPRRRVVRKLKEALVKCIILSGVPRVIEASFALREALEPGDRDSSFVRAGLAFGEGESEQRGAIATRRIYGDKRPISGEVAKSMRDIEWLSLHVTYGTFLAPMSELSPAAPLSIVETEVVTLSCMIAQRAKGPTTWHLRAAVDHGIKKDEIEAIQEAVEMVAAECGTDVKTGMPHLNELDNP